MVITESFVILFFCRLSVRSSETIPKGEILSIVVVKVDMMDKVMGTSINNLRMRDEFT